MTAYARGRGRSGGPRDKEDAQSKLRVACECAADCAQSMWVRFADYEFAQRRRHHYAIAGGHVRARASRIVIRGNGYDIVSNWQ